MQTIRIEWKHLDVDGDTCDRCYDTGENLNAEVKRLNRKLESKGFKVEWFETKLNETQMPQSNALLFNGVPIEEILEIKVSETLCESCSDLVGHTSYCRTVLYEGVEYEEVPAKAIREATFKLLDLNESNENCSCCSDCGDVMPVIKESEKSDCSCGTKCCS